MARVNVVTGSSSGIGKATKELLERRGETVIGVDLRDAQINVDLTTSDGRSEMFDEVHRLSGGRVDAVLAIAGIAAPIPATVAVNYFGMVATLADLRPFLAESETGRAAGVASRAVLYDVDDTLVDLMLEGDEPGALTRAAALVDKGAGAIIYASTKKAFARWLRREAPTPQWAGEGIALNAVAPAVVATTGITQPLLSTNAGTAALMGGAPMPLNGFAPPAAPAGLLAWLVSAENSHMCGQVIFIDGGSEAILRGDNPW
jgi:NAD(P)-dependent dehydrogenase (short-subunit alcohol dehydrogenase family)